MPLSHSALQRERSALLDQMAALDRMERGRIFEQFFKGEKDGQPVTRGPYYVLQRRLGQEVLKERVPLERLPTVQADIRYHQEFQKLADRYAEITEEMTHLQDADPELKKTPHLPSRSVPRNPSILKFGQAAVVARWSACWSLAGRRIAHRLAQGWMPSAGKVVCRSGLGH